MAEALRLQLPPDWDAIKSTWDATFRALATAGLGEDLCHALCTTAQELLENAVKYGAFTDPADRTIALSVAVEPAAVILEVKNPTDAEPARLKSLDETIQWIRGYQTPFEAYVERLKEISLQPFAPDRSGLGLVRVAYEGQCILDFYVDAANILAVSAVHRR